MTELDRKPSSCPFLYTWNGTRFEFVTDFMGGGELGYWEGPNVWNTAGSRRIRPHTRATNSSRGTARYELRVTNELEETMFVDRLQLIAVDHPAGVEAYPNEGLKARPIRRSGSRRRVAPDRSRARQTIDGRDVTARLTAVDRRYPDGFRLGADPRIRRDRTR